MRRDPNVVLCYFDVVAMFVSGLNWTKGATYGSLQLDFVAKKDVT